MTATATRPSPSATTECRVTTSRLLRLASFADKNVGNGKAVSVSGISVGGGDASNYSFNATANTTANITAKALTVSAPA
jgi:hypothetical protein